MSNGDGSGEESGQFGVKCVVLGQVSAALADGTILLRLPCLPPPLFGLVPAKQLASVQGYPLGARGLM